MLIKNILAFILYQIGRLCNYRKYDILSLYFHNPRAESFIRIVRWLKKHGYQFISLEQMRLYVSGELQLNTKSVCVSLDDGWANNLALLSIIEAEQIPITIFLSTEPMQAGNFWWEYPYELGKQDLVEYFKTLDEIDFCEQLQSLKNKISLNQRSVLTVEEVNFLEACPYISFGSHTVTHPILTKLTSQTLEYELSASKNELENLLKCQIDIFSYPNGSYTDREKNSVKKYYSCAFSTIQSYPQVGGDLYEIPRIALTDEYWPNLAKIVGVWHIIRNIIK